jgi:hypothetical protein
MYFNALLHTQIRVAMELKIKRNNVDIVFIYRQTNVTTSRFFAFKKYADYN